jgi:hypothetical protein
MLKILFIIKVDKNVLKATGAKKLRIYEPVK